MTKRLHDLVGDLIAPPVTIEHLALIGSTLIPHLRAGTLANLLDMDHTTANSYHHSNGFFKLLLASQGPVNLRLHVWPGDYIDGANVHAHKWNLLSAVLAGSLRDRRYAVVPGNDWGLYEYDRHRAMRETNAEKAGEGTQRITSIGKVGLSHTEDYIHSPGSMYLMLPGTYHWSRSMSQGAVTLVVTDLTVQGDARIVAPGETQPVDTTPRQMSGKKVLDTLQGAAELLRNNQESGLDNGQ